MKKFSMFYALLFALTSILSTKAIANAAPPVSGTETRQEEINELLEQRMDLKFEENVDSQKLNEIESKLNVLGVEFLADEEVKEKFPEAYAAVEGNEDSSRSPNVVVPVSEVNDFSSYRVTQYYNGKNYNVQFLIVQPTDKRNSTLWNEQSRRINYSVNWIAGTTNFIETFFATALGEVPILGDVCSIYDICASTWTGLRRTSEIDPADVSYDYENKTTVSFAYVRLENYSDDNQILCNVSSKTKTYVAYSIDVDYYTTASSGAKICEPGDVQGHRYLYCTSPSFANPSRAAYIYENYGTTEYDCIQYIKISGPEYESEEYIWPCSPLFPAQCIY